MEKDLPMPSGDAGPSADTELGAADSALPGNMQPHSRPGEHAVSVLWSFGKCLGALLPVYLAGYFGFSVSLVLFGLVIYMGWKHSRDEKHSRLQSAMYLLENEQDITTTRVFRSKRDLPSWVSFSSSSPSFYCVPYLGLCWLAIVMTTAVQHLSLTTSLTVRSFYFILRTQLLLGK